jgi:hypothetical protein
MKKILFATLSIGILGLTLSNNVKAEVPLCQDSCHPLKITIV